MTRFMPKTLPEGFPFMDAAAAFHTELKSHANEDNALVLNHIAEHFSDPLVSRIRTSTEMTTPQEAARFLVDQFFTGTWKLWFNSTDGHIMEGTDEFDTLLEAMIFADTKHWSPVTELAEGGHIDKNLDDLFPKFKLERKPMVKGFHIFRTDALGNETLRVFTTN